MKKKFIIPFALLLIVLGSCSSDDDKVSLNKTSLSLNAKETSQLEATEKAEWSSESEFVAKVDKNGLVTGNHVGKTFIVAKAGSGEAKCQVEVTPKYNTYVEPVLEFGSTKAAVKSKEKRELIEETDTYLLYDDLTSKAVNRVAYWFKDGKLLMTALSVYGSYVEESANFLMERYQYIGNEDGGYFFINNDVDKCTMGVRQSVESGFIKIEYYPNSPNSRAVDTTIDYSEFKEKLFQ